MNRNVKILGRRFCSQSLIRRRSVDVTKMRNGEWGMGKGKLKWEIENGN